MVQIIGVVFVGAIFGILARFSFGRQLLLNYPKLFSFGFVSHEGPSEEAMNKTKFSLTLYAEGWPKDEGLAEPTDKHTDPPTKKLTAKVTGNNPGYGATCIALLVSAVTILKEHKKMPEKYINNILFNISIVKLLFHFSGGVFPPGAAFANTNMISELGKYDNGMYFNIVSAQEKTSE